MAAPGLTARLLAGGFTGAWIWAALAMLDILWPSLFADSEGAALAIGAAGGLALIVGAVHGCVHEGIAALVALGAATLRRRLVGWILVALGAGAWVFSAVGGTAKLAGGDPGLAVALAVGLLALAVVLAALLATAPEVWTPTASRGGRTLWGVTATIVIASAVFADRHLFTDQHAPIHAALRVSTAWILVAMAQPWSRWLVPARPWRAGALALAVLAWAAAVLALVDDTQRALVYRLHSRPIASLVLNLWRGALDGDGDGYSAWLGGGDCAPADPRVHPGAPEIADNGLDDNCVLGDAHRVHRDPAAVPVPSEPSAVNVVLVTIDTLAASHMSLYGASPSTTPVLDEWARDAVVFDRAYTTGGWTAIAIPSLLRGVYPRRLQWDRLERTSPHEPPHPPGQGHGGAPFAVFPVLRGAEDPDGQPPPLAWWLARRGMVTSAVVDDGGTMLLGAQFGTAVGFDNFSVMRTTPAPPLDDRDTVAHAQRELAALQGGAPFFLWVHLYGPHLPSDAHPGVESFGTDVSDRYDHEIAATDAALAPLLSDCASTQRPTVVIVTADHGEVIDLGQRYHGTNTDENVIWVPLILRAPGVAPRRVGHVVSTVDIVPTVLALTDTPAPERLDGVDLTVAGEADAHRIVLTDTWRYGADGQRTTDTTAALRGDAKLELLIGAQAWQATTRSVAPDGTQGQRERTDPWVGSDLERAVLDYLEHAE